MDRVEIGTYVSCVPGICFIGDFMVDTKAPNFVPLIIIAGSIPATEKTSAVSAVVIVIIVCMVVRIRVSRVCRENIDEVQCVGYM